MNIRDNVYLISTIFQAVLTYKFIAAFLGNEIKGRIIRYLLYAVYYSVIVSVYLFIREPIIIIPANILMLCILTLNHESTIKRKILSVLYAYSALVLSETIAIAVLRFMNMVTSPFPLYDNEFVIGRISSLILMYSFVLLYNSLSSSKDRREVPLVFWAAAIIVPLATLVPSAFILFQPDLGHTAMILTTVAVFTLNFLVFYLYNELIKLYQSKMEKEIFILQSKAYSRQLDILETQAKRMKTFKHDIINHISSLKGLTENNDLNGIASYLNGMHQAVSDTAEYVKIPNQAISSILNFKIGEANKFDIHVKCNINIPDFLNISAIDLTAIIGNLFDNAIEALKHLEKDREIKFSLVYDKGIVTIVMENEYSGNLISDADKIITSKKNKEEHGLGLLSIKNAIQKYGGIMDISTESHKFRVAILLHDTKVDKF